MYNKTILWTNQGQFNALTELNGRTDIIIIHLCRGRVPIQVIFTNMPTMLAALYYIRLLHISGGSIPRTNLCVLCRLWLQSVRIPAYKSRRAAHKAKYWHNGRRGDDRLANGSCCVHSGYSVQLWSGNCTLLTDCVNMKAQYYASFICCILFNLKRMQINCSNFVQV